MGWIVYFIIQFVYATEFTDTKSISDAIERFKANVETLNKPLNTCKESNANQELCNTCASQSPPPTLPTCEDMAYDFCTKLWSAPNKGNLELFNNQGFLLGNSKSGLSKSEAQYFQALFEAFPRLPDDIRKIIAPEVAELKRHFKKENPSKQWHNELNIKYKRFSDKMRMASINRLAKENPQLKGKKLDDLSSVDLQRFYEIRNDTYDELAKAQFQDHSQWQKVERLFSKAQLDIQHVIERLPIQNETKAIFKSRISKLKLQLPSADPRKGFENGCISNTKSAFFYSHNDTVVMCAGFFLGIQNEDTLYSILTHELGHSIQPVNFLGTDYFQSPGYQLIIQLCEKPNSLDCQKWKDFISTYKTQIRPVPRQSPWITIEKCWKENKNLKPYSQASVEALALRQNSSQFSEFAQASVFSDLANHKSKFFMNPQGLLQDFSNDHINCKMASSLPFIFTQELKCSGFQSANVQGKKELFTKALQTTQDLAFENLKSNFNFTGESAAALSEIQLGLPLNEKFADWMAHKAMAVRIQNEPNLDKRKQSVLAAAASNFCAGLDDPSLTQDLEAIEKKHSLNPYPTDRERRLSFFTKEIRQMIQCQETPAVLEATKCDM